MSTRIKKALSGFEGTGDELIPLLQRAQREFGYLSKDSMQRIAKFTRLPASKVYAVATFYAQFCFKPTGRNQIAVCRGTACHVRGASSLLEELERCLGIKEEGTTSDLVFSLKTVACIGACALSPCIVINKKVYAKVVPEKVEGILSKYRRKS